MISNNQGLKGWERAFRYILIGVLKHNLNSKRG
jgi:hypothetical protein